jgi:hypothetical protein
MGRTLKRVPMDFNWPIDQIWKGYFNPYHGVPCKTCKETGYGPEARQYKDEWYGLDGHEHYIPIKRNGRVFRYNDNAHQYHLTQTEVTALIENNRIWDLRKNDHIPTPEEVNEWAKHELMGHDSLNEWICMNAVMKEKGIDPICPVCNGHSVIYPSEDIANKNDEWYEKERFEPPEGEGYQLWETTSEGSPMSPVFKTASDLADYCAKNCSVFGGAMWSAADWLDSFGEHPDMIGLKQGNAIFI